MSASKGLRLACFGLLACALAAFASSVNSAAAGSAAAQGPASKVAGVETTRLYINGFRAVGRKVVGRGTAIATFTNSVGRKTIRRKHFRIAIRTARIQKQQAGATCQILFLQLGELDLTLAGLHAVLHAADPTQPVELRLSADDAGGILGRLFCQLANASGVLGTAQKAKLAATQMNKHLRATTIMRVKAVIYAPNASGHAGAGMQAYSSQGTLQAADECSVLHLVLGPLHLELLGLVADLNKIVLDLTAVPGTLLGNVFCQLVTPPPPPPPPAPAYARG
jgi:hypothetical protein